MLHPSMYWAHLFKPHDTPRREVLLSFTVEESEVWRDRVIWYRSQGSECPQKLSFLYWRQWNSQKMRNPIGQRSSSPPSVSHTTVRRVWRGKETPWEMGSSPVLLSFTAWDAGKEPKGQQNAQTPTLVEIWFQAERWESCIQQLTWAQDEHSIQEQVGCPFLMFPNTVSHWNY